MSQKKPKFNIIDMIVILILVAAVAFVAVRMFGSQDPAAALVNGSTYTVTFRADCVPEEIAATLKAESACENSERTMDLGKLMSFTTGPSVSYTTARNGQWVVTEKPGHVSVTLVCELTATGMPTGLRLGKYMLNMGQQMSVCFGLTELPVTVTGIAIG